MTSEPESLDFLISLRDYAENRAIELHVTLELLDSGERMDYPLTQEEQIDLCKIGIYCWTNELRLYDRLIAEYMEE